MRLMGDSGLWTRRDGAPRVTGPSGGSVLEATVAGVEMSLREG